MCGVCFACWERVKQRVPGPKRVCRASRPTHDLPLLGLRSRASLSGFALGLRSTRAVSRAAASIPVVPLPRSSPLLATASICISSLPARWQRRPFAPSVVIALRIFPYSPLPSLTHRIRVAHVSARSLRAAPTSNSRFALRPPPALKIRVEGGAAARRAEPPLGAEPEDHAFVEGREGALLPEWRAGGSLQLGARRPEARPCRAGRALEATRPRSASGPGQTPPSTELACDFADGSLAVSVGVEHRGELARDERELDPV